MADRRSSPSIDARTRPSRTPSGCCPARSTGPRPPVRRRAGHRRGGRRADRRGRRGTGRHGPARRSGVAAMDLVARPVARWSWRSSPCSPSPRSSGPAGSGCPGLRILFGGPSPSAPRRPRAVAAVRRPAVRRRRSASRRRRRQPRSGPPAWPAGSGLGLGTQVGLADLDRAGGLRGPVAVGPADRSARRRRGWTRPSTTRWRWCGPPSDRLPATIEPGVGLILTRSGARSRTAGSRRSSGRNDRRARPGRRPARVLDHRRAAPVLLRGTERARRRDAPLGRRRPAVGGWPDHVPARDVARATDRCDRALGHRTAALAGGEASRARLSTCPFSGAVSQRFSGSCTVTGRSARPATGGPHVQVPLLAIAVVVIVAVAIGGFLVYDQVLRGDSAAALTLPSAAPSAAASSGDGRRRARRATPRPPPRAAPRRASPAADRPATSPARGRSPPAARPATASREQLANLPAERDAVGRTDKVTGSITLDVERLDDDPDRGDADRRHDVDRARTSRSATTGCAARDSRPTPSRPRRSR